MSGEILVCLCKRYAVYAVLVRFWLGLFFVFDWYVLVVAPFAP